MKINFRIYMLSFFLAFVLSPYGLCDDSGSVKEVSAPDFEKFLAYGLVREELIKEGWKPVLLPNSDLCKEGDTRCSNRPEMHVCSDSGNMPCVFVWKKENYFIKVFTAGTEGEAEFDSLEISTDLKSLGL